MNKVTAFSPQEKAEASRAIAESAARDHIKAEVDAATLGGQPNTSDFLARLGRPLASKEIQRRLKIANPNLHFELSKQDYTKTGVYVLENKEGVVTKRFVVGMESGLKSGLGIAETLVPEFTVTEQMFEEKPDPTIKGHMQKVPTFKAERARGWRTVLAGLIKSKLISKAQADRYFEVSKGRSDKRWKSHVDG